MFSFGIVMWELLTGEEPYADLFYGAIIGNFMGLIHAFDLILSISTVELLHMDFPNIIQVV